MLLMVTAGKKSEFNGAGKKLNNYNTEDMRRNKELDAVSN